MPDDFNLSADDWKLLTAGLKSKGKKVEPPTPPLSAEELGYDPITLKNEPKFKHDLKREYVIQRWNGNSWEYYPSEEYRFLCADEEQVLRRVQKDKPRETFRIHRFFVKGEK